MKIQFTPPSVPELVAEELQARGWTEEYLMSLFPDPQEQCAVMLACHIPEAIVDKRTAKSLSRAFGVSAKFFINLSRAYLANSKPSAQS